jgi:hypothetical protein
MSRIGCREINVEADSICLEAEADHPAVREEALGFPNRENRLIAQVPQDCRLPAAFVTTEKEDVAASDARRIAQQTNVYYAIADEFALQCALEFMPLLVIVEDAEVKGSISVADGVGRPVHKLGEVKKKRGLHLVFFSSSLSTNPLGCSRTEQKETENRAKAGEAAGSPLKHALRRIVVLSLQLRPPAQKDQVILA